MVHLLYFLHIPEPLLLSSSDAAESVERTWTTFGVGSHQNATIISRSVCAACVQVFVKGKVIRLFFGSSLQLWRRSRSEYGGCDLSQVSLPRLEGPKSIIGQKLGCIMYCRKAETEKGGNASVCVCACLSVSTVLSIMLFEIRASPRSWQQWHQ